MYIETIKRGKKNYYYLAQTIRSKNKFKKIRWYLAKGIVSKEKLGQLAEKASKMLEEKVQEIKKNKEVKKLDKDITKTLAKIKKGYKELISKMSTVEYSIIEKQHLINFTFNTNAIEGNTVTLKETAHILEDGITPEGRELREVYEIENTKKAYKFMRNYEGDINNKFIKKIHYNLTYNILNGDAGNFRRIQVYMGGSKHKPPSASDVQQEMNALMRWIKKNNELHEIILAVYVYHYFIAVHPFLDGNGRTGRLLLNFMFMNSGYPPICIKKEEKIKYINCLEQARDGNVNPLLEFIIEKIKISYSEIVDNTRR